MNVISDNVTPEDLDTDTKLNILVHAMVDLFSEIETLKDQNAEISEKLQNLTTPAFVETPYGGFN